MPNKSNRPARNKVTAEELARAMLDEHEAAWQVPKPHRVTWKSLGPLGKERKLEIAAALLRRFRIERRAGQ